MHRFPRPLLVCVRNQKKKTNGQKRKTFGMLLAERYTVQSG